MPCGAGQRIILNFIGSKNGFLDGCGEVFVGKKGSHDYHHEMNSEHFEHRWLNTVLPASPQKSVTVIDNARYHSRQTEASKKPTTKWRKAQIQEWLRKHGVTYQDKDTIPILLSHSKKHFVPKEYVLEDITKKFCQETGKDIKIIRLPVGHSELNPIELIWAQAKYQVARANNKFNITTVTNLITKALNDVSAENWCKAIEHTKEVENAFRKIDFGDESTIPVVEQVIIDVTNDEDDTDNETDNDEFDSDDMI